MGLGLRSEGEMVGVLQRERHLVQKCGGQSLACLFRESKVDLEQQIHGKLEQQTCREPGDQG